jgi:tRNA(fMet)-specific endonuclease VapC
MRYLVDSDWVIDGLIGIPNAVATLDVLSQDGLAVSIVSLGEIFEGAFGSPNPSLELQSMRRYLTPLTVVSLSDPIMETFARVRSMLRRQGRLIPDIDLQIAATAVTLDLVLLTRNRRHFDRVPGLRLYETA